MVVRQERKSGVSQMLSINLSASDHDNNPNLRVHSDAPKGGA